MGLMGTLAKVAMGYAAAQGVDKLSGGEGITSLLGGGAQVAASDPTAKAQAQMLGGLTGGEGNPMQAIMDQLKDSGLDLSSMMGGLSGGGANPLAAMMQSGGFDLSALMGGGAAASQDKSGLLSSVPEGGTGMAGLLAAAGGAAAMGGKSMGGLLDQFSANDASAEAEETAALMLRAMIQAAKADGDIDQAEKSKILETVGSDADASDIAFVQAQLDAKIDIKGLAKDTPDMLKSQVYSASLMTIRVDTAAEAQYLDKLAKAMELPEPAVNMLHIQMGIQPLYS